MVSEGVTWQSLYLTFLDHSLAFIQPEDGGASGNGRVVSSTPLARLVVQRDPAPPVDSGSPARRLILAHEGYDAIKPPGLFLFEELPESKKVGPFVRVQPIVSSLDVWFQDENSVERAYRILQSRISTAEVRYWSVLVVINLSHLTLILFVSCIVSAWLSHS